MLRAAIALVFSLLLAGQAQASSSEEKVFLLSSNPKGSAAFHYFRGRYYFIGFTPLKLSSKDLNGKTTTRILLTKFGYEHQLFDLKVDGDNKSYKLTTVTPSYVRNESGQKVKFASCKNRLEQRVKSLINKGEVDILDVQLPIRWGETVTGPKVVVIINILNRDDIVAIKKAVRKDKELAIARVEELVKPTSHKLINRFKDLGCVNKLLLIATYQDKGMKIDFTPYRDYWTATTRFTVGNTTYVTTAWGSTIELQKDMQVSNKEKRFLFEYKMN